MSRVSIDSRHLLVEAKGRRGCLYNCSTNERFAMLIFLACFKADHFIADT
jgi:hypothetical protein